MSQPFGRINEKVDCLFLLKTCEFFMVLLQRCHHRNMKENDNSVSVLQPRTSTLHPLYQPPTWTFPAMIAVSDSVNVGKNSQLGKHGFGSLHNLNWTCYLNEDILLRHWLRFASLKLTKFPLIHCFGLPNHLHWYQFTTLFCSLSPQQLCFSYFGFEIRWIHLISWIRQMLRG